jgi:hypothetical protein
MPTHQPAIVDLGLSDTNYLEQLARGHDPVKEYHDQLYETVLMNYGIQPAAALAVAPLMDKLDCSIEERLLVNQSLKCLWHQLTGQRRPQTR